MIGTCKDFYDTGTKELKLNANQKCAYTCMEGYARTKGTFACNPNNPDGSQTTDKEGKATGSIQCKGTRMSIATENTLGHRVGAREREPSVLSTRDTVAHLLTSIDRYARAHMRNCTTQPSCH